MISHFIAHYGYFAVLLGTMLEGESILLAAGFACHQGLMSLPIVFILAVTGATLGDLTAFALGRWQGRALISRFACLHNAVPKVTRLLERYDTPIILAIRFLVGLRMAGPVIIGTTRISAKRFAWLNLLGALIWATLILSLGFSLGLMLKSLITDVKQHEEAILLALFSLVIPCSVWLVARHRQKPPSRHDDRTL